jgi:hypothetical protein
VSTTYKRLEYRRGWLIAVGFGALIAPVLPARVSLGQPVQEERGSPFNAPWEDLLSKIPPPSLGVNIAPPSPPGENLLPPPDVPGPLVIEPLPADPRPSSSAEAPTTRDIPTAATEGISSERAFSHTLPTAPTDVAREDGRVTKAPVARVPTRTGARSRAPAQSATKPVQGRKKTVQRQMSRAAATTRAGSTARQRRIRQSAARAPTLSMPEGLVPSIARPAQ